MVLYLADTNTTLHTRLNVLDTLDACTREGERIAIDMMDAYPGDRDTWFSCHLERV